MRNDGWLGPYTHGRKVRFVRRLDDGRMEYKTADLYGPWPPQGARRPKPRRNKYRPRRKTTAGFIYFVQCNGPQGPVKIGSTNNIDGRMCALRNGCPYELVLVASFRVDDDVDECERRLLDRFKAQRIRGEWFNWSAELQQTVDAVNATRLAR